MRALIDEEAAVLRQRIWATAATTRLSVETRTNCRIYKTTIVKGRRRVSRPQARARARHAAASKVLSARFSFAPSATARIYSARCRASEWPSVQSMYNLAKHLPPPSVAAVAVVVAALRAVDSSSAIGGDDDDWRECAQVASIGGRFRAFARRRHHRRPAASTGGGGGALLVTFCRGAWPSRALIVRSSPPPPLYKRRRPPLARRMKLPLTALQPPSAGISIAGRCGVRARGGVDATAARARATATTRRQRRRRRPPCVETLARARRCCRRHRAAARLEPPLISTRAAWQVVRSSTTTTTATTTTTTATMTATMTAATAARVCLVCARARAEAATTAHIKPLEGCEF